MGETGERGKTEDRKLSDEDAVVPNCFVDTKERDKPTGGKAGK